MSPVVRILLYILAPFGTVLIGVLFIKLCSSLYSHRRTREKMDAHIHWGNQGQGDIGFTPQIDAIEIAKGCLTPRYICGGYLLPGSKGYVWYVGGPEAKLQYTDFAQLKKQYRNWGLSLRYWRAFSAPWPNFSSL